jgi:hypothetical protein
MPPSPIVRLRRICLSLPDVHEVEAWGEPTFRIRNKLFAIHAASGNHHGEGRAGVWIKAAPGNQALMVQAAPKRFFVPPYVGPAGWIGVWLDGRDAAVDWTELAALLDDGRRLVAPKRLLAAEAAGGTTPAPKRPASRKKATARKATAKKASAKKATARKTTPRRRG